ncbi:hypothetical protein PVAND_006394 [Polypedilum vanderplanki]|uniref:Uncharacterized protein n=1 Tax=Polypedilum vanderplanki TaxID=319348 RepID=A0A9J6C426_POLVA|nr:hypothetical protein PVAND_006394 [Polypedilum vanderplanki]
MSTRKVQQDLNISGFSPLKSNNQSNTPKSNTKSPSVKDYGIIEAIDTAREKLISGYDKWKIATSNGCQCINIIHNIKEKARKSGDTLYPAELENYSKKLESFIQVFQSVIFQVSTLVTQMRSSINILSTMNDNDELKYQITIVEKFLIELRSLYEKELKVKSYVIENIAHTNSTEDSYLLVTSWSCNSSSNEIYRLITQLKISPNDYKWCT